MEKRKEMMQDCPEDFEERLKDIIDEIEQEVNAAKDLLDNINAVDELHMVEECRNKLGDISTALY